MSTKPRRRAWILSGAAVLVVGLLCAGSLLNAGRNFAAVEKCMIGAPLEPDEQLSERLRLVILAGMGEEYSPFETPVPGSEPGKWPHRCVAVAGRLSGSPGLALLRPRLAREAFMLQTQLDKAVLDFEDCAALWEAAAGLPRWLGAPAEVPAAPLPVAPLLDAPAVRREPPVFGKVHGINAGNVQPFDEFGFTVHGARCTVSNGPDGPLSRLQCARGDAAMINSAREEALFLTERGVVDVAGSRPLTRVGSPTIERQDDLSPYWADASYSPRAGVLFAYLSTARGRRYDQWVDGALLRQGYAGGLSPENVDLVVAGQVIWHQEQGVSAPELRAARLLDGPAESPPKGYRPEQIELAAPPVTLMRSPRHERLYACYLARGAALAAVHPGHFSVFFFDGQTWSPEIHLPASREEKADIKYTASLTCAGEEARLAWRDRQDNRVRTARCTAHGCDARELPEGAGLRWLWLGFRDLGPAHLMLWEEDGRVLLRVAPLADLATAPTRFLYNGDQRGDLGLGLELFHLHVQDGIALIFLGGDPDLFVLRVTADGEVHRLVPEVVG